MAKEQTEEFIPIQEKVKKLIEESEQQEQIEETELDFKGFSEEDRKNILPKDNSIKEIKDIALMISYFSKAIKGLPLEDDSIVTKLTDIKELLERSRFPTMALVQKQVYLNLWADEMLKKDNIHRGAIAIKSWAILEAKAMISYTDKGKTGSRFEWVEMTKAEKQVSPSQSFFLAPQQQQQIPQQKRGLLSRKSKEESEF